MAELLRMPEITAGATEAVLQEWQVAENGPYTAGDPIAAVETEKAVVEVEAESDGVLLRILVEGGASVEVGAPIALVGEPGETVTDVEAVLAELGVSPSTPAAREGDGDAGDGATPASAVSEPAGVGAIGARAPQPPPLPVGGTSRPFTSPLARRMASEAGIQVSELVGTGPGGRIVRRDVAAAIARQGGSPASTAPAAASLDTAPQGPPARTAPHAAPFTDTPPSRIRRAIAARLAESKRLAPHFYVEGSARVDALLGLRGELNASAPVRITVNDLVVKAAARAHALVPAMNVIWTEDAVRSFSSVDIAVAIATDGGLVTPVLRSVDTMPVSAVATAVKDYSQRASSGRLHQSELEGGTLTVTNLGMYGTEAFTAIINPPQAAILAVGAARQEPVVEDGRLGVGTVLRVTLSVDHRPVDGVVAAEWMRAFLSLLEHPLQILA